VAPLREGRRDGTREGILAARFTRSVTVYQSLKAVVYKNVWHGETSSRIQASEGTHPLVRAKAKTLTGNREDVS